MIGGLKQTTSRLAIAAAAGMFAGGIALTPAQAADLGGDCCADLEERVAELEATTVRKGNRKVSVKLSGQVNRAIMWWDDGTESDIYLVDPGISNSRFRITGDAVISAGRKAGFRLEWDIATSNGSARVVNCDPASFTAGTTQCRAKPNHVGDGTADNSIDTRYQDVWVSDEKLGKVSLGQGDMAGNGASEVDLSGGVILVGGLADSVAHRFRFSGTTVYSGTTQSVWDHLDGASRKSRIRYDTPTIGGFTFSTSYAADDWVDFAARYAKEWNSVRCAAAAQWTHDTNESSVSTTRAHDDREFWSASASCLHTPSGLNLTVAFGDEDENNAAEPDTSFLFIKGGISRRWNSHGKTNIMVAYGETSDSSVANDEVEVWGAEINQAIDSAAMTLYLTYENWEYSSPGASYDDIDVVFAGAKITF